MKKILLFAGQQYYPSGGASDLVGDFDTVDEAKSYLEKHTGVYDWADAINTETREVIKFDGIM